MFFHEVQWMHIVAKGTYAWIHNVLQLVTDIIRGFSEIHTHPSPSFLLYAIGNWNQEKFSFSMVHQPFPGLGLRYDTLSLMSSLSAFELGPWCLSRMKWRYIWCCKDLYVFSTYKGQGEAHGMFQELNFEPDLYVWNIYIWISSAKCYILLSPTPKSTSFPYMLKEFCLYLKLLFSSINYGSPLSCHLLH